MELTPAGAALQQVFGLTNRTSTTIATSLTAIRSHSSLLVHPEVYPAYATGASLVILFFQISRSFLTQEASFKGTQRVGADDLQRNASTYRFRVAAVGGTRILAFHVVRALASLALLSLSVVTLVLRTPDNSNPLACTSSEVFDYSALTSAAYSSLLTILTVVAPHSAAIPAARHANLVLLILLAVYSYRDIWPLATFTLQPLDLQEGLFLWGKIVTLVVACVMVPLCIPRTAMPVYNKNGISSESPEETASVLSLMTYSWLDGIVAEANRVSHLPVDRFPSIATTDHSEYLIKRSFKHLDPLQIKKRRHAFWGLMRVFWAEYIVLGLLLAVRVLAKVIQPLTLRYLLMYLEQSGANAIVRPWVWIALLFIGPAMYTIGFQWYLFLSMKTVVQAKAIITQLVFDHALRARVRAEAAPSDNAGDKNVSVTSGIGGASATDRDDRVTVADSVVVSEGTTAQQGGSTESAKAGAQAEGGSKDMIGKIINLISTDLDIIMEGRDYLFFVVEVPLQVGLSIYLLYSVLGWSAFVGLGVIILSFPIIAWCSTFGQDYQVKVMKKSDSRVRAVTDILGVIRMVKLFGWESRISSQIDGKRQEELKYKTKFKLMTFGTRYAAHVTPLATLIVTFFTYTVIMKRDLSASAVFSSITLLDMLRDELVGCFWEYPRNIQAKVSLDRLTSFLYETELLDDYDEKALSRPSDYASAEYAEHDSIGIRNASFTWMASTDGATTPALDRKKFVLRIDDGLTFKCGAISLIVGPTGCGKTSLLLALLGEMHHVPLGPESYVRLPRSKGVAYAPQESWVLNRTIRENILFGSPFEEERYNKVIEQCGLQRDLSLFEAGDKTEVGEKGLTLSGGQKARVTLARAIYSPAEILLLDDVLAALDVHTARWIVERCFAGDLVKGRTVILVTHNIALTCPVAEFVVSLGPDGQIRSYGSPTQVLEHDKAILATFAEEKKQSGDEVEDLGMTDANEMPTQASGKLFIQEEVAEGRVGWPAILLFLKSAGGKHVVLFWVAALTLLWIDALCEVVQPRVLGAWASQYANHPASEVSTSYYLTRYALVILVNVVIYSVVYFIWVYGVQRASREIHRRLVDSVLGTTLRWLDATPTSRIITRCTQDINSIENVFAEYLSWMLSILTGLILRLIAILSISPLFTVPSAVVGAVGLCIGRLYLGATLCVKRENSNAHAPVLDNFGAAVSGLVSIRAYGAQEIFRQEGFIRMDTYTRTNMAVNNLGRWVAFRMELLGAMFASGLAAYLVYVRSSMNASDVGYSMVMAINFTGMFFWLMLASTETEISANSLERIHQYVEIEQEPKPTSRGAPPALWPSSGKLVVETLSARYSANSPRVLDDISFEIQSGERVGVVGRTGSGKSSLTLALLRCIITEGKVYYDNLPTDSVNLDALRTSITIIPQIPELLSGTVRDNLDPFNQHDDAELNDTLRTAGLNSLQSESDGSRITLDTQIAGAGGNLSVGQRQILALARAIVRQSKLLILDEATSAIDYHTDTAIQESLRKAVGKDVSLLVIAHRLQTIMDADKIMVLDAGRIIEFDSPIALLSKEDGQFKAMVDGSGDKEKLYALAHGPR